MDAQGGDGTGDGVNTGDGSVCCCCAENSTACFPCYDGRSTEPVKEMNERDEQYALLASNGMLVKRPLLVTPDTAIPGFKEPAWKAALNL